MNERIFGGKAGEQFGRNQGQDGERNRIGIQFESNTDKVVAEVAIT
jgi:hypothetical protein